MSRGSGQSQKDAVSTAGSSLATPRPAELVDLFGYTPMIAPNLEPPVEQLHELLDGIQQHQPFVERNLARLRDVRTWDVRVAEMLRELSEHGYEAPRGV